MAVIHWVDTAFLISGKFLNSISELLQEASHMVQQWCYRTESANPQKMVIVPLTTNLLTYSMEQSPS